MLVSEIFDALLANLKFGDASTTIAMRRDEITKALNKTFRSIEGSTANRLMVGSYGRHTAIRGVSDLDLIYILPPSLRTSSMARNGTSQRRWMRTKPASAHCSSSRASETRTRWRPSAVTRRA